MTIESRRKWRLFIVVLFIISTSVAGYLWGNSRADGAMTGAIVLTVLSVLLLLGAETLVTMTENDSAELAANLRQTSEELDIYKGKVTELDRTIELMMEDNDEYRREIFLEKTHGSASGVKKAEGQ